MLWFCSVTSKLSYIFSYSEWWRYIGSRKPRQPRIRKVPAWASNRTIRGLIYDINIQSAYGGLIFFTREQGSLLKKRSAGCALARSENLSLKRPRSAREFRKRNSIFSNMKPVSRKKQVRQGNRQSYERKGKAGNHGKIIIYFWISNGRSSG